MRCATLRADTGYGTQDFVATLEQRGIKHRIAGQTNRRRSAVDGRAARGNGYAMSLQIRERIEQGFGGVEPIGDLRRLTLVSLPKVRDWVAWTFVLYNLIRLGGIDEWWDPSAA